MTMENFKKNIDEISGTTYIEFIEDPTKTRQSGLHPNTRVTNPKMFATEGERCPVALFDLYVSKRPLLMRNSGRFYLTPKQSVKSDVPWYTCTPVGKNTIGKFMKEIISGTPLENSGKKLTNHSGRKTLVKKMKQASIPETSIIKVTGHKSTTGLKSYDPGDQAEFQQMSNVISGRSNSNNSSSYPLSSLESRTCSSSGNVFNQCSVNINYNVIQNSTKKRKYVIYSDESSQSQ